MTEKSRKVNESQIDFLKPCPKEVRGETERIIMARWRGE